MQYKLLMKIVVALVAFLPVIGFGIALLLLYKRRIYYATGSWYSGDLSVIKVYKNRIFGFEIIDYNTWHPNFPNRYK